MAKISISDIASLAGVDRSTVSLALNGNTRIAEGTRQRIVRLADSLGYRPNFLAKGLAGQKTKSVGMLVRSLSSRFFTDVVAAMEKWFNDQGYCTLLSVAHRGSQAVVDLAERFVDGIATAGVTPAIAKEIVHFKNLSFAAYLETSQAGELSAATNLDLVVCDMERALYQMTSHLIGLGHRRIVYMGAGPGKEQGYRRALAENGLPFDPGLLIATVFQHGEPVPLVLPVELFARPNPPTAIVTYRDDCAVDLILQLEDRGLRVPQDVSVTGIDDSWNPRMSRIPLTTLRLPAAQIGQWLAEMLFERMANPGLAPRAREAYPEMIVRQSTAPCARG